MGIKSEAFQKLEEAHSQLRIALAVVHCYGKKDGADIDAFDIAVNENIDKAMAIADELSGLLTNAQIDEAISRHEVAREIYRAVAEDVQKRT